MSTKNPDPHCNYSGEVPCHYYSAYSAGEHGMEVVPTKYCPKCLWWDEPGTSAEKIQLKECKLRLVEYKKRQDVLGTALSGVGKALCGRSPESTEELRLRIFKALEEFNTLRASDPDYNDIDTNWIYAEMTEEEKSAVYGSSKKDE